MMLVWSFSNRVKNSGKFRRSEMAFAFSPGALQQRPQTPKLLSLVPKPGRGNLSTVVRRLPGDCRTTAEARPCPPPNPEVSQKQQGCNASIYFVFNFAIVTEL
jgi:hypothetical protein